MNLTVTETATSVLVSENPAGVASGVLAGNFPSPTLNYGEIDHLAMARSSFRMWSDFSTNGDWSVYTFNGGSSDLVYVYDGSTFNLIRATIGTTQAGSRVWITDRENQLVQGMINGGRYEMTFAARVRLNKLGVTNTICRVGLVPGHVAGTPGFPIGSGENHSICFWCLDGSTWIATSCTQTSGTEPVITGSQTDSLVDVSDWHVLKIHVNAAGTEASFWIDDVLIQTVTDQTKIPNDTSNPSTGDFLFAGTMIRSPDSPATAALNVEVDWQYFEAKVAR